MYELFFGGGAGWFSVAAFVGTVFFATRLILLLVAGHGAGDLGADMHVDVGGHDFSDAHHGDSSDAFKVLSVQSIAAFLMGAGWGGLGGLKGAGWGVGASLLVAAAAGFAMVWILGLLLKGIHDLQSSGNVHIEDAVGCEGDVYLGVPASGTGRGQVRVVIDDRQRIYPAVSTGDAIASQSRIRVVQVNEDHTLTVAPV